MRNPVMPAATLEEAGPGYAQAVRILILLAAAIATTVLLGWMFQVEPMKRIVTGLTSMNPMTAICFEASCVVLWLQRRATPQGWLRAVALVLPLFVLAVGVSKLLDLWTGSRFCPDDLLFRSQLTVGQIYPSRIAPNVAMSFVLLSVAMLVVDRPRWPAFLHAQWLVIPILCAALAALIGYTYDASGFYTFKQYIPMALHSAIDFILLAVALILSRPAQGYLRLIPQGSPGARSYARLLPACVLIPSVLGGLALVGTDHGWLDGRGTGASIVTVLTAVTLSIFAFLNSVSLNAMEDVRQRASLRQASLLRELDTGNRALQLEIAERRRLEEEARHQATHDALTGLPNRLLFLDRLQHAISRTIRQDNACALFYVDVDHFKPVNDRYGHQVGDELLKLLAQRLRATLRDVDTVARLGGDEFAAIMDSPASTEAALLLARRLSDVVSQPYTLEVPGSPNPVDVQVGISIGIALFPGHATDLDALIRIADSAMYRAKSDGKTRGLISANIQLAIDGQRIDSVAV